LSNPYAASANNAYRASQVLTSSRGQLVVLTFDGLLTALQRARVGITMNKVEVRCAGFEKSLEIIGELLASLDQERGGSIAKELSALYVFLFGELTSLGVRPELAKLDTIIAMVRELRDAFHTITVAPRRDVA